jgi:dienelactone hydrolase
MRRWICALAFAVPFAAASAAVKEEPVTYKAGDTSMKGVLVYDDATKGKRPGMLVVHEWWGITRHTRDEARKLAGQGYTALVVDMYGDGKTADNPKDASALSGAVLKDPTAMMARFDAARDVLARHATVDASRIGAIGFCFGGSIVLDAARAGTDLAGVAAFHAGLDAAVPSPAPGKVKARVLVLNGAADPFIKPESVAAFKREMDAAKASYRYVDYPGAVHAFTNPEATAKGKEFNLPLAYSPEADKQSKAEMSKFFSEIFKK